MFTACFVALRLPPEVPVIDLPKQANGVSGRQVDDRAGRELLREAPLH
jgi:hypothetical protein